MRKSYAMLVLSAVIFTFAASARAQSWQSRVSQELPLLGHRNWILIVDSAYPEQVSPGVETVVTNANQLYVLRYVLSAIQSSIHVRPIVFLDAELPFVPDKEAFGVASYRSTIARLLKPFPVSSLPHEKIIANVDQAGRTFHVLVLKSNMTIPYTSVFIRLNAKYWSDDAEKRLRDRMSASQTPQ
ncbi:MAG TPA: hypothetical protein VFI20_10480 [Terracidiphilus sp.]|nr:hypothetical protein [Terracidiphilus sp.]